MQSRCQNRLRPCGSPREMLLVEFARQHSLPTSTHEWDTKIRQNVHTRKKSRKIRLGSILSRPLLGFQKRKIAERRFAGRCVKFTPPQYSPFDATQHGLVASAQTKISLFQAQNHTTVASGVMCRFIFFTIEPTAEQEALVAVPLWRIQKSPPRQRQAR